MSARATTTDSLSITRSNNRSKQVGKETLKRNNLITTVLTVAFLTMVICLFAQLAQAGIYVTLDGPGVGPGDTIICGQPVTFSVHLNNNTGNYIEGMTHGFEVYSSDGATWQPITYDTSGGLGDYFDMLVSTNGYSITGTGADTVALAASVLANPGMPNGYDDVILRIVTQVDSSQDGKTLCIDSTYCPPSQPWMWATPSGNVVPSWGGPYCFPVKCLFVFGGYKYNDQDGSGTKGAGEPGLPNWTIYLYDYNNTVQPHAQTTTDNNGMYCFSNLDLPPSYATDGFWLAEKNENGWKQTEPDPMVNNGMRQMQIGFTWDLSHNFGNIVEEDSISISGIKFYDINGNSNWEHGNEPGLGNVLIRLRGTDDLGNPVNMTDLTDPQGVYSFDCLAPGDYRVLEEIAGTANYDYWAQTYPLTVFHTLDNLQAGDHLTGYNFGNDTCDLYHVLTEKTCLHGTNDNFSLPEPSYMSQGLRDFLYENAAYHWYIDEFDLPADNHWFGHTFEGCWDDDKCEIMNAELTIHLKATGCIPSTDGLALGGDYSKTNNGRIWSMGLSNLEDHFFGTGPWEYGNEMTITLDLKHLPTSSWLPTDIRGALQDGNLDIIVTDDTEVDYIQLWVELCCKPCDDLHEYINTGYDHDQGALINPSNDDDDWELIGTEDFFQGFTPLVPSPALVTSDPGDGQSPPARWIGLPTGSPQDNLYWFEYTFCLDDDFLNPVLNITSGEANDSIWIYLNEILIAGPYDAYDPITFSVTSPLVVGKNRLRVKLNVDPSPSPTFILNGYIDAEHGECCDTGACCDCDYNPECYYTDEMTCLKDKGAFHRNSTCNTIDCNDACYAYGDINDDGLHLTISDLTYLIQFVNIGGPPPNLLYEGDLNGDCYIDQLDVDIFNCYLIYGPSCFTNGYPVQTCCCPDTTRGACCALVTSHCDVLSPFNCQAISHNYIGDYISCTPNPCPIICCLNRGNVDGIIGVGGPVDVADLTYLVTYLFKSGPAPPCEEEGNADGIVGVGGPIDVADLTYLVAYLFKSGPAPPPC